MTFHIFRILLRFITPLTLATTFVHTTVSAEYVLDLGEISVTASRAETEIKNSPVAIEIIGRNEIETVKFSDSLNELLTRITGNSLNRNLRIPMSSKDYTLNLVDGMAIGQFGDGTNDFIDQINTFDIDRIEVIKGPASSVYSSNALGGVINVITRNPPTVPEYRIWGEMGKGKRQRGGLSAAGKIDDALGYFFDTNTLDYEGLQDRTAQQRKAASGKLVYDFDTDTNFSVRGEYLETYEENPGKLTLEEYEADWLQAALDDTYSDERSAVAIFSFVTDLGENSGLDIKYSIRDYHTEGLPFWSLKGVYSESDTLSQNIVATFNHDFDFLDSRIIAGVDFQHSNSEEIGFNGRLDTSGIDLQESWDLLAKVTSPFFQYEFSPIDRARITIGARRENITYSAKSHDGLNDEERVFASTTPKAGITFDLDASNSIWFGYSEGFVVPSALSLWTNTGSTEANSELLPEEAKNYELGVRGRLLGGRFKYDVALYDTSIKNMVLSEIYGTTLVKGKLTDLKRYVNVGLVEVKGVETSLSYQPVKYLKFDAAHTFAKNKYLEYLSGSNDYSGNYLKFSPLHHLNARITWMPRHDLGVELEWDHISSYYTNIDNDLDPDGQYQRPDLFNLRATYNDGSWEVWGHILNLTNRKYGRFSYSSSTRYVRAGSERSIYAGVSYNW